MAVIHIFPANAQPAGGPAVGQWKSYLPYGEVTSIATDGTTFYCGTNSSFFTYNRTDGSLTGYNKETGMHDVAISKVGYDALTGKTIIAYTNSNLDLFKNNTFTNIPAIKLSQQTGDKTIYDITILDGEAYLSTGLGLIVVNLDKEEIKESISFYDSTLAASVASTTADNTYLYAATSVGLFRVAKNSAFIQNYLSWTKLDNVAYNHISASGNVIYASKKDSLFELNAAGTPVFKEKITYPVSHLDAEYNGSGVWISAVDTTIGVSASVGKGFGLLRKEDGSRADSFFTTYPSKIIQLGNGEIWYGDESDYRFPKIHGLRKKTGVNTSEAYFPSGPITNGSQDVSAYNGDFYVAHAGKSENWAPIYSRANFSHYTNGRWDNFDYVSDNWEFCNFVRILNDQNTGKLYSLSFYAGLYERDPDGTVKTYTGPDYFSEFYSNSGFYMASGLALDQAGNLWMTNYAGNNELVVKTYDDKWYKMRSIDGNIAHSAVDVIVDDYGLKWFVAVNNQGIVVYNDNGTIENTADDTYRVYKAGDGAGNLPDNNTLSIAKDKDGAIWVGTSNGIGIISCGDQALDPSQCQAYLKPYQDDQFAGYLFQGQTIEAIAVDGANRKWIGTHNGVWLLSADGGTIISQFTVDNSPLPDNNILRINIDPVTGDVYFSTAQGLIAYKGTATDGGTTNADNLFIFPNPVPTNFNGMIAIRGVADNSDVRITDIAGQLVYRTKANGGEAVWNGMDYTGHKAQSGVYLVFAVNKDGTQKTTGKFIIHR